MEAIAKWDFVANVNDLLSFQQGDTLQVLFQDANGSPQTWYRAQLNGKDGLVSTNMIEIKSATWFYGNIDRGLAEKILTKNHARKFLIRQSQTRWFLSYRSKDGKVWHFQILRTPNGNFSFFSNDSGQPEFASFNKLAAFVYRSSWYSAPWWIPHLSLSEDPVSNNFNS